MVHKLKQRKEEGFTLIEVMIVLAIAALILLVVLLAVPALQRSARNTTLKSDASALSAAVTEYASNNNGVLPANVKQTGSVVDFCDKATCSATVTKSTAKVQGSTVVNFESAKATPTATKYDVGKIDVVFGMKCSSTSGAKATLVASPRGTAIVYSVETSGTASAQCIDS